MENQKQNQNQGISKGQKRVIAVSPSTWFTLMKIKIERGFGSLDAVIKYLLKKRREVGSNASA